MSVYHCTLHACRSWRADHEDGYTSKSHGVKPPDPHLASVWDNRAKQPPVEFSDEMQDVLIAGCVDFCSRRQLTCHGGATDSTHLHVIVSHGSDFDPYEVRRQLKNVLSLFLGRLTGTQGRRWWVDDGNITQVNDREHFDYLFGTYFPSHKRHWTDADPAPTLPPHIKSPERTLGERKPTTEAPAEDPPHPEER